MRTKIAFFVAILTIGLCAISYGFTVRVIHFVPKGSDIPQNIEEKIDESVKKAQEFFSDELERHGYGKKTFRLETKANGKIVIHRINGRLQAGFYKTISDLEPELSQRSFLFSRNIELIFFEGDDVVDGIDKLTKACGRATENAFGVQHSGLAVVFNGHCLSPNVIAHELGHAFGFGHVRGNQSHLMTAFSSINDLNKIVLNEWEAGWLNLNHYFNDSPDVGWSPEVKSELTLFDKKSIAAMVISNDRDGFSYIQCLDRFYNLLEHRESKQIEEFILPKTLLNTGYLVFKVMDSKGNYTVHHAMFSKSLYEPEDINRDGRINEEDLALVVKYFGTKVVVTTFGNVEDIFPNPDVNGDLFIDKKDLDMVIKKMDDPIQPGQALNQVNIISIKWADLKRR